MDVSSKIDLRLDESFPHLARAPITEAVLELRTLAESVWVEAEIQPKLKEQLPDYPGITAAERFRQAFVIGPGVLPRQSVSDLGWQGLQFRSSDGRSVAGFYRDSFVFSKQRPYTDWERFTAEALRLWDIHASIANPSEIQRVGLRFINQVDLESDDAKLGDFLRFVPHAAEGFDLPFNFFFHQDSLAVPGHPYVLTLNRALQPKQDQGGGLTVSAKLILDIDVSTTVAIGMAQLRPCISEMRWLKNKAFFGNFTEGAIESFK